jgi:hypothetical protein
VLRNGLRKRPDSRARLLDEPDCHLNIASKGTCAQRYCQIAMTNPLSACVSVRKLVLSDEPDEDGNPQEVISGATVEKIVQRITAVRCDSKVFKCTD